MTNFDRYQLFYCPSLVIQPQVQITKQSLSNQELQSPICSSTHRGQTHQPNQHPPPLPTSLVPIKLLTPYEAKVSSSSSGSSLKTSDKTIKISITRRKLKVTSGGSYVEKNKDLTPMNSILKSSKITTATGKGLKRSRTRNETMESPMQTSNAKNITKNGETFVLPKLLIQQQPKGQIYPSVLMMTENKMMMNQKDDKKCAYCETFFTDYTLLNDHMMSTHFGTMTSGVFTCSPCQVSFRDYENFILHCLKNHSSYSHGSLPEDPFIIITPLGRLPRECHICHNTFNSTKAIKAHYINHLGPSHAYRCRLCQHFIPTLPAFRTHLESTHFIQFKDAQPQPTPQLLPLISSASSTNGSQFLTCMTH